MLLNVHYRGKIQGSQKFVEGYAMKNLIGGVVIRTDGLQEYSVEDVQQMICFDKNGKRAYPADPVKYQGVYGRIYFNKFEIDDHQSIPAWCVSDLALSYDANLVAKDLELITEDELFESSQYTLTVDDLEKIPGLQPAKVAIEKIGEAAKTMPENLVKIEDPGKLDQQTEKIPFWMKKDTPPKKKLW